MANQYDPDIHHRRSRRLEGYDYSQAGAYFITVCTRNRECLFGDVIDGVMALSDVGRVVEEEWMKSADIRKEIELDAFVIMPNHIHGIIVIANDCRGVWLYAPTGTLRSPSRTIGALVRAFKSACTIRINDMRNSRGTPVWQRNYYEHVTRDEDDLNRIRQYVIDNPARWAEDENNPDYISMKVND
ncbi:MAG: transposase [Dehalococcoidia bacterium]